MRAPGAALAGMTIGAIVAGGVAWLALSPGSVAATREPSRPVVSRGTAEVERRTLRSIEELAATLGYDGSGVLLVSLGGTITRLPEEGDILESGEVVVEVDGNRRSALLYGSRPAWRTMRRGTSGADVLQLERGLKALGYLGSSTKPDRYFGEKTVKSVKEWQKDLDVRRDGVVDLGEVTFTEGPVRIAGLAVDLGGSLRPGSAVARTTSSTRVVTLELEADRQDLVATGDAVGVELPDGTVTSGRVAEIATVAEADPDGGDPTVDVTIALDMPEATGSLDGAPVTVGITRDTRTEVLTVPVDALLALQEGGYAVEVVEDDGSTRLVGVDLGLFADGRVQVEGAVTEADRVVVPR